MTPEQENQKLLSDAHSAKLATWESLQQGVLKHYEELATKAHHWSSIIPSAIKAYKDPAAPDPFIEWLDQQIERADNKCDALVDEIECQGWRGMLLGYQFAKEKYLSLSNKFVS